MESNGSSSLTGYMNGAEKVTSPSHLEFTSQGHTISKEYREELRKEEEQFWNRARDMPRQTVDMQPSIQAKQTRPVAQGGAQSSGNRSRILLPDSIQDNDGFASMLQQTALSGTGFVNQMRDLNPTISQSK